MDRPEASTTPSANGSEERLRLLSPIGGEAILFERKSEAANWETIGLWIDVMQVCARNLRNIATNLINDGKAHMVRVKSEDKKGRDEGKYEPKLKMPTTYEEFKEILAVFNQAAITTAKLWKGASFPDAKSWSQDRCDVALMKIICQTTFSSAVHSVKALNSHYAPFSSEVYGETSYDQIQLIIEQLKFKESDVFVDLGSGVGHIVLYVAGGTKVRKCIGIEKAEVPAGYATTMNVEFKKWMGWFKKKYRPYELHAGDFLDPKFRDLITKEATIVFINNYAFNPDLEMKIKRELIEEMRDGTRIVSTKAYASAVTHDRLTQRHMNDVTAILDVYQLDTVDQPCSWTDKHVPYFLHTVNRAKLEKFFTEKSNSQSTVGSRRASVTSRSSTSSREGSAIDGNNVVASSIATVAETDEGISDDDDGKVARGPTTRHKWKTYCDEIDRKKRKASPPASPRWNEADREYVPPGMKKAKKERKEEKKKKEEKPLKKHHKTSSSSRGPRLSDEQRTGIETLHSMIASPRPIEADGPGLVRVNLSAAPDSPSLPDVRAVPSLPPGAEIFNPVDPIDLFFIEQRRQYKMYAKQMNSEDFKQTLYEEIQAATAYNQEIKMKVREKEQQVQCELNNGMTQLSCRLKELGMPEVATPSELLQSSKRIVAQHKELTQSVSHLEADVTVLQGKLRVSAPYADSMLNKLHALDDQNEDVKDRYGWFIQRCASDSGYPAPKFEAETDSMAEVVLSPTGPRRRTKPRSGPGRKGKSEENNEEVERKVQEIVQVALLVDNQAKEKERRARAAGAPEKPPKKSGNVPSSDPVGVPLPRNTNFPLSTTPTFSTGMQSFGRPDLSLPNQEMFHNPSSTAGP